MNLTHLIMFQFWTGASEVVAEVGNALGMTVMGVFAPGLSTVEAYEPGLKTIEVRP